ncbi:MAG TPA: hypothetical protein DCS91_20850 [Microcoleaceae bacterium UBA11344]|jgi:Neurotransmitter-gated ion-channel transmembrane region./Neurotransmitter-gated ion-channel ligand binding domain.|nr:hypothetical protein [Microcoleaceae cyanobacterium UBA11344]
MNNNRLKAHAISALVTLALTAALFIYSPATAQNTPTNSRAPGPTTAATTGPTAPPETSKATLKNPPNADKSTEVVVGFYLTNLGRINQSDETFDVSGYLSATWKDRRLAFDPKAIGDREMRYSSEKIWEPALTIVNSQSAAKKGAVELTAQPDGTVNYLELINATVSSDLDLRKFPFDSQTAKVVLESLSSDERRIVLKTDSKLTGYSTDSFLSLSEWQILGFKSTVTTQKFELENKTYSRYTFELKLKRNHEFYIFKVFIPLLLITLLSWATFWFDANAAFSTQMSVGMTSTLTAITFNFTVANALPRLSYLTLLDAYIFICYIFFFLSIIANVTVHCLLNNHKNPDFTSGMIQKFRWMFPLAFILFQGIVMTVFLGS